MEVEQLHDAFLKKRYENSEIPPDPTVTFPDVVQKSIPE
jgi:hypothetical protein